MKKFAVFVLLFLQTVVLACKCEGFGAIGTQYQNADFVGEIEILKVNPKTNSRTYIAEVKTLNIYKGKEVNILEVLGRLGNIRSSACETELLTGEKYIIYLSKSGANNIMSMTSSGGVNISEKYVVSRCTPKSLIDTESKNIKLEQEVLNFLMKNPLALSQAFYFDNSNKDDNGDFKKFELFNPTNHFAVYRVKVNDNSEVEKIQAIQNFGSEKDQEIMNLIRKNFVIIKDFMTEVRDEEVLLTLFYIPENKNQAHQDSITRLIPTTQQ